MAPSLPHTPPSGDNSAVEHFEIFLGALFVSVAGLNAIARWLSIPYPIPLVLGGLVLGLLPGIPEIELEPDLVLVIFLPPLLYAAAFFSDLRALRSDLRAISIASIGLVLLTMGTVAVVAHAKEATTQPWPRRCNWPMATYSSPSGRWRRRTSWRYRRAARARPARLAAWRLPDGLDGPAGNVPIPGRPYQLSGAA